tara:strand:- start:82 stop:348 length:267 start_codon:yes stop_codon:yes gene_type:complete
MKTRSPYLTFNMQDQMDILDKFDLAQIQASAKLNMKLTKKQTLSVLLDSYLEGVPLAPKELIDTPPVEEKPDVTENNTNNSGYISPYG